MIYQLKRSGINQNDLIRIYVSVINQNYMSMLSVRKYPADEMINLPTLHRRRDELCTVYFAKMKRNDHKLNALLPNGQSVPYALRLCNKLPIPSQGQKLIGNRFRAFSDRLVN